MLTLSLDIKVGPKIMAILGTPILLTLTSSVTLKRKKKINNQYWDMAKQNLNKSLVYNPL